MESNNIKREVPPAALLYIVNNYLLHQYTEEVPVTLGIDQHTAEAVVNLFINWAVANQYDILKELKKDKV